MRYIEVLEDRIGRKATIEFKEMQPGDVFDTWADCADLAEAIGYHPATPVEVGLDRFVTWYKSYYRVN
jgi:UDP-glucuronate 4-epimerase